MAKFEIITYIFQSCFLWAGLIITVFNLLLLLSFYAWKLKFFFLWFSLMTTQSQVWTCSPLYSWKKYKENWKQPSLTLCLREWEYSESPETSLTQGTSATSVFFVGGGGGSLDCPITETFSHRKIPLLLLSQASHIASQDSTKQPPNPSSFINSHSLNRFKFGNASRAIWIWIRNSLNRNQNWFKYWTNYSVIQVTCWNGLRIESLKILSRINIVKHGLKVLGDKQDISLNSIIPSWLFSHCSFSKVFNRVVLSQGYPEVVVYLIFYWLAIFPVRPCH